jgi:hypothetical protein
MQCPQEQQSLMMKEAVSVLVMVQARGDAFSSTSWVILRSHSLPPPLTLAPALTQLLVSVHGRSDDVKGMSHARLLPLDHKNTAGAPGPCGTGRGGVWGELGSEHPTRGHCCTATLLQHAVACGWVSADLCTIQLMPCAGHVTQAHA